MLSVLSCHKGNVNIMEELGVGDVDDLEGKGVFLSIERLLVYFLTDFHQTSYNM